MPTTPNDMGDAQTSEAATFLSPRHTRQASPSFVPGTIIAGRYRIVLLLGRGGMGEVYRADDLMLDQPVALKFLPTGESVNPARLAQLHSELRIARQVSHKNVCRLYDLGEYDGRRFLTMQYVDGEDLASLLRRIGRVPQDKALDLARQLCAGLGAAHERGVIHRDLKPANVLIDGQGHALIADFGIATPVNAEVDAAAGTPHYMAPEQLRGQSASIRSDVYALGLVLYELLTGRRARVGASLDELRRFDQSAAVRTPSSHVPDIDPRVERVVLQCLDPDPSKRPASALAVAAALPGGDPLAMALAAGETPSPAAVAAAGRIEALPLPYRVAAVAWIGAGLLFAAVVGPRVSGTRLVPLDLPPVVLADRAEQILASLGFPGARTDVVQGFETSQEYEGWIAGRDQTPSRYHVLQSGIPIAVDFWYRTSDRPIVAHSESAGDAGLGPPHPSFVDPPLLSSRDLRLRMDTRGRLLEFHAAPPPFQSAQSTATAPSWSAFFAAAGLSESAFRSASPQRNPSAFADTRAAWEGNATGRPDVPIRVEAAAYQGRPISFEVIWPWTRTQAVPPERSRTDRRAAALFLSGALLLMVSALVLNRFHMRSGRADVGGATALAVFVVTLGLVRWLAGSHHVADVMLELGTLRRALEMTVFSAALLWILYVALEPYARRYWPGILLGWSRLLSGHLLDARVGRDIILGVCFGIAWSALLIGRLVLPELLGYPGMRPRLGYDVSAFDGVNATLALWCGAIVQQLFNVLALAFLFVALRRITRYTWIAVPMGVAIVFWLWSAFGPATAPWIEFVSEAAIVGVFTTALIRFGVLTAAIAAIVSTVLSMVPLTTAFTHWSAAPSTLTLVAVLALGLFGIYAASARHRRALTQ